MKKLFLFLIYILSIINGFFFTTYFRIKGGVYLSLIFSFILFFLIKKSIKININLRKKVIILIFSIIFSFFTILGYKLNITNSLRGGTYSENYIANFVLTDLHAFIFICIDVYSILKFIIAKLKCLKYIDVNYKEDKINIENILLVTSILFLCYIPYFFVYYPGIVIADSNSTIYQVLYGNLNNQFSYFYSLYFGLITNICNKNLTLAIAVSTILQMLYTSFGISYLINWIKSKGISKKICIFLILLFGIVPFLAVQSIIMWRDTIFSISVMLWTLLLLDYCISDGKVFNKRYVFKTILLILLIVLSRNNGFFVILVTFLFIIMLKFFNMIKFKIKTITLLCFLGAFLYLGILSPIYERYNLKEAFSDSLAIPLQQMASVVVNNGKISKEDNKILNNIIPTNLFFSIYKPCVVDPIKWNKFFNDDYIKKHKLLFFKTYLSLMVKNPLEYIKAWGLETYGFWAFNNWELNKVDNNILDGAIYQLSQSNLGVKERNLLENDYIDLKEIFIVNDKFISLSIVNWFIFFVLLVVILNKNYKLIIGLSPSIGLIFSLLISSPIAYWQRYGLAEYYLLPIYIIILIYGIKEPKKIY